MESSILSLLIFLPVLGAVLMLPVAKIYGKDGAHYYKWIELVATGLQMMLTVFLYLNFDPNLSIEESPFTVQVNWISHFNIQYFLGIDGLSMPMVLLTAFLSFICILISWNIKKQPLGYFSLFLFRFLKVSYGLLKVSYCFLMFLKVCYGFLIVFYGFSRFPMVSLWFLMVS